MRGPVALTGTPGTGKTATARSLDTVRSVEVGDLALAWGAGTRRGRSVEVDLARLRRRARRPRALEGIDLVVGHLAHFLPVRAAVVLRCHPLELARRLGRARRGSPRDRTDNVVCEALGLVRAEAVTLGVPIAEIDTTGRPPDSVAAAVERYRRSGRVPRGQTVDWLADERVTRYLLDRAP